MSELKPCPFCGKDMQKRDIFDPGEYTVYCNNCGALGPNDITQKRADEMWNLRRPEDALRTRIAELEAATRWIPVEKWLPLDNQIVIGYIWFSSGVVVCSYCKWEGAFYEYWRGGQVTVTHWQPLPQPPEAQECRAASIQSRQEEKRKRRLN